jgi:hypothetical protein
LLGRMLSTQITHQGRIQGDTRHKVVVSSETGGCRNRRRRHWIFEQVDQIAFVAIQASSPNRTSWTWSHLPAFRASQIPNARQLGGRNGLSFVRSTVLIIVPTVTHRGRSTSTALLVLASSGTGSSFQWTTHHLTGAQLKDFRKAKKANSVHPQVKGFYRRDIPIGRLRNQMASHGRRKVGHP